MSMTPKERWLAVLKREKPDRVPMDYWGTNETTQKLMRYLGCADEWAVYEALHIDRTFTVTPTYRGPARKPGYDIWGCRYVDVFYDGGIYSECVEHPLAQYDTIDQIEANFTWPTADWFDYSHLQDQIVGKERYPLVGGGSEPFLDYKSMRGMEQAYIDLVENPDLVCYCLDKMFTFAYQNTLRIYEQLPGQIILSYIAEDFGGQQQLLCSPAVIRTIFIPRMKRMIDLAHQAGVYVFFHSDGAIRAIVPDMIAAGIDILNPVQWRCSGMDRAALKRDFGDRVIFHGGVDNQFTLPFGSPSQVHAEAAENLRILGQGGGYILAPCHNIQAVSPVENILTLYRTGYDLGRIS